MNVLTRDNLTGENHEGRHSNTPLKYLTSTSLIGDSVFNRHDENLGAVKDIMINLEKGTVEYFVIEFGGFLGIGEKFFAIPFRLMEVDDTNHRLILDQKKEILQRAPGFDQDHWPDTNAHGLQETYTYWGGIMGPNVGIL